LGTADSVNSRPPFASLGLKVNKLPQPSGKRVIGLMGVLAPERNRALL